MDSPLRALSTSEEMDLHTACASLLSDFGEDRNLHALAADLADVSLISLARAVNAFREAISERYIWMYFYAQEPASFEPTVSPREPFNLEFSGDRLRVLAQYVSTSQDRSAYPIMHQLITPLLRHERARVIRTSHLEEFGQVRSFVEFDYGSPRGVRVAGARRLAERVSTLAGAVAGRGALDAEAVEHVVLAGRADLLDRMEPPRVR